MKCAGIIPAAHTIYSLLLHKERITSMTGQQSKTSGRTTAGVFLKKKQMKRIITMRVSELQKEKLDKLSHATNRSISDIIREGVELWSRKHGRLCAD